MRSTSQSCTRNSEQRAVQSCPTSPFLSMSTTEDMARKASVSWESCMALLWPSFFLMLYCFKWTVKQIKCHIIWHSVQNGGSHTSHHSMVPNLCDAWRAWRCSNSVGRVGWKRKSIWWCPILLLWSGFGSDVELSPRLWLGKISSHPMAVGIPGATKHAAMTTGPVKPYSETGSNPNQRHAQIDQFEHMYFFFSFFFF